AIEEPACGVAHTGCIVNGRNFMHQHVLHRMVAECKARFYNPRFRLCTKENEKPDENEEWIHGEARKHEHHSQHLAQGRCSTRSTNITRTKSKQRAEHPSAVHGKSGNKVEQSKPHVYAEQRRSEISGAYVTQG